MYISHNISALCAGFVLDALLGDPHWWPHPVQWIGKLVEVEEKLLRSALPETPSGEKCAGAIMAVDVIGTSVATTLLARKLAARIHPALRWGLETLVCYRMLAAKSLKDESTKVEKLLREGNIEEARNALSMIVGRDTDTLSSEEIAKAAVETVAENASDGVIAPLLAFGIAGAPGIVAYKAINTMDSMVGYRTQNYLHFGSVPAHIDDLANYLPSRIAAAAFCLAAPLLGYNGDRAFSMWRRDGRNHLSPNSAQTEAACAGALGIQLGGGHTYFGEFVDKPTIGDDLRETEPHDIRRANNLMYAASLLVCGCVAVTGVVCGFLGAVSKRKRSV